jgi:chaperonin cofactor prefoldin
MHVDDVIEKSESKEELNEAKRLILSHIFTLRKENRHLLRRIQGMESSQYGTT